jgi:hypothetical protein
MSTLISSDLEVQIGGDRLLLKGQDSKLVAHADSIWALLRIRKVLPKSPKQADWGTLQGLFQNLTISCVVGRREVAQIRVKDSGLSVSTRWMTAFACLFSTGRRDRGQG